MYLLCYISVTIRASTIRFSVHTHDEKYYKILAKFLHEVAPFLTDGHTTHHSGIEILLTLE